MRINRPTRIGTTMPRKSDTNLKGMISRYCWPCRVRRNCHRKDSVEMPYRFESQRSNQRPKLPRCCCCCCGLPPLDKGDELITAMFAAVTEGEEEKAGDGGRAGEKSSVRMLDRMP